MCAGNGQKLFKDVKRCEIRDVTCGKMSYDVKFSNLRRSQTCQRKFGKFFRVTKSRDVMSIRKWNQWDVMSIESEINEMWFQLESEIKWDVMSASQRVSEVKEQSCQVEVCVKEMARSCSKMWDKRCHVWKDVIRCQIFELEKISDLSKKVWKILPSYED